MPDDKKVDATVKAAVEDTKKAEAVTAAKVNNDTVKESEQTGKMTTDAGAKVESTGPAVSGHIEEHTDLTPLTFEEQEELLGELEYGETGWLPTDEVGNITGPAKKGTAPVDQFFVPVRRAEDPRPALLTTPSGAHLTHRVNPSKNTEKARRDYASLDKEKDDIQKVRMV